MSRSSDQFLRLPAPQWWRIVSKAEAAGRDASDVLVAAVNVVTRHTVRQAVVIGLAHQGFPDRVIAELAGETREYVQRVRRSAGFEASKKKGRNHS